MSAEWAATAQVGALVLALALSWKPLGDHLAGVMTSRRHARVELATYRLLGVDPDGEQRWAVYARGVLALSLVGTLVLYLLLRVQAHLPLSLGRPDVPPALAWNTAVSFVTNTNWQAYAGESTLGHLVQMTGLTVQNVVSAAVGLAVAFALLRGLTRHETDRLGSFWVDLVRIVVRVLLPLAVLSAVVLVATGVVQNLYGGTTATTLVGEAQRLTGGPVASQEAVKLLGTNGGGFYNANSAHPFENPTPFSNLVEVFLLLLVPVALTRTFGTVVGDRRQGLAVLGTMGLLWLGAVVAVTALELHHPGAAAQAAGSSMEGKELRFGVPGSSLFAVSTTGTSTGAVNSFHSSYGGVAGGVLILMMGLGEVAPGGVGSGLYGLLVLAVVTVFVCGLMVGRTPEYLGKKLRPREMRLVAVAILVTPVTVLVGTAVAISLPGPRSSILNPGPHGLSEVLYAFMSAANNNGSAFAGLSVDTGFYDVALGVAMLVGRFAPMVLVLALAGSLAEQRRVPAGEGTLPTGGPLFTTLLAGVTVVVAGLTFFPALALGPLAEGLA